MENFKTAARELNITGGRIIHEYNSTHDGMIFMVRQWTFAFSEEREARFEELGGTTHWNYYVYIPIVEETAVDVGALSEYFHGGITYDEVVCDGKFYKLGCDYSHFFDEDRHYTFKDVYSDCIKTIEKIKKNHPEYFIKQGA